MEQHSAVIYDLELLKEDEHQRRTIEHKHTRLMDVPDEVLVAECARRNLRIHGDIVNECINTPKPMKGKKGEAANAIEKVIALRYQTIRELGIGSSSTVYEVASKKNPENHYALKVMLKGKSTGSSHGWENTDNEMAKEVSILRRIHHPSIASCVEVFESVRAYNLVLERLLGGELKDLLSQVGAYTEYDARIVTRQLLEAIQYLELIGIAHRDVKIENVLLTESSCSSPIKLCDFGLAVDVSHHKAYNGRLASSIKSCQAIQYEAYHGTLVTMAPEVMQEDVGYGPLVDIYSAGCVVYSLLSGFYPFDADSTEEFEDLVRNRPVEFPAPTEYDEWNEISDTAKDFLNQVMNHFPMERPTAAEALQLPWLQEMGEENPTGKSKKAVKKSHKKAAPQKNVKNGVKEPKRTVVSSLASVCTLSTVSKDGCSKVGHSSHCKTR